MGESGAKYYSDSLYLFDEGFGQGDASIFTDADSTLGQLTYEGRPEVRRTLRSNAVEPTVKLLRLYDSQLQLAPFDAIVAAHCKAEGTFSGRTADRLSISALMQRSTRGTRHSAGESVSGQQYLAPMIH